MSPRFDLLAPQGTVIGFALGPAEGPACGCCSICWLLAPVQTRCSRCRALASAMPRPPYRYCWTQGLDHLRKLGASLQER